MPILQKVLFLMVLVALTPQAHAQTRIDADNHYAIIYNYFAVGNDSAPSYNVTKQQFIDHIDEISKPVYTIRRLPDIIHAFKNNQKLPQRTIAITFDGADKSIFDYAAPLLIDRKIPFTIFVPSNKISDNDPSVLSWKNLRDLRKTGLVDFGIHPAIYGHLSNHSPEDIKRHINNSIADVRKNLGIHPKLFAYPFGEYTPSYSKIIKEMGFDAAFGQQSGAAQSQGDFMALPRFTVTENFGDMDRFLMTANSLPLPVYDISPPSPALTLSSTPPSIGFTLADGFTKTDIKSISCFSSMGEKTLIDVLENRLEIRPKIMADDRMRLNCTMPVEPDNGADDARWRWFGMLFYKPDAIAE